MNKAMRMAMMRRTNEDEVERRGLYNNHVPYRRSADPYMEREYVEPVMHRRNARGSYMRNDDMMPDYDEDYPRQERHYRSTEQVGMDRTRLDEPMKPIDKMTAKRWVDSMHGTDPAKPHGGKWTLEEAKSVAQRIGMPVDGEKIYEFYVVLNMLYSDYCAVAKKHGVCTPEFFGDLAKAWIEDDDAVDNKTSKYFSYIVDL